MLLDFLMICGNKFKVEEVHLAHCFKTKFLNIDCQEIHAIIGKLFARLLNFCHGWIRRRGGGGAHGVQTHPP